MYSLLNNRVGNVGNAVDSITKVSDRRAQEGTRSMRLQLRKKRGWRRAGWAEERRI
ncbi:hypothetical protein PISMIDRAFT_684465 [Pisolithus microcarpus 441]|uniref:Uncharacterized protein n=1 Tax=Pisolithus microcarpus 441 TaxID=765257 RepID=A0A0C9YW21_9AGAM|nr:hypothetical protein PISMIDRAFT_684465 [Pisolithus microcarpus 441]